MKKIIIIIITICLAACMTFDVLAGGDNGTGTVSQQQVSGNPYERRP